jgi:glycosyltransferase involved in cell wall biosynthesis
MLDLLRRLLSLRRAILAEQPATVLVSTSALMPVVLVMPRRVRVIVHVHEVLRGAEGMLLGLLMTRAQAVIAPSEVVRRHLPLPLRRRCEIVPNGTPDPGSISASPSDGPLRLLVASRWGAWKGHHMLLEAWSKLTRDDLELLILGGPPPTGSGVDVDRIVEAMPNSGTVSIVGEVPDSGPHIDSADAVLVPSTAPEPFGLVAIEGLARGKAVIATDHGGCAEIVDRSCGWLLPPDAGAWQTLLESLDPKEVRQKGLAGRRRYESLYSDSAFRARIVRAIKGTK